MKDKLFSRRSPLTLPVHVFLAYLVNSVCLLGGFDDYYTSASEDKGTPPKVKFDYKLTPHEEVKSVTVKADGVELYPKLVSYTSDDESRTAILFLIDTSNPRRKAEVAQAKKLVLNVLGQADINRHKIGIYPFHGQIDEEFAPIGSRISDLKERAAGIKANGINTILYGSVLKAITILEKTEADRKAIVVISDWKSEDNVMDTKGFVTAALKGMKDGKIVCHSVVLVEEDQSELDTAEKLSDETGGTFVKINKSKIAIPESFSDNLLGNLENGGAALVDMSGREQAKKVVLEVVTKGGKTYSYEYDREAKMEKDVTPADPEDPKKDPDAKSDGDSDGTDSSDEDANDPTDPASDDKPTAEGDRGDDEEEGGMFGLPIWVVLGGIGLAVIVLIVLVFLLTRSKEEDVFDENYDSQLLDEAESLDGLDGDETVIMGDADASAMAPPIPQHQESFEIGNGTATCRTLPDPGEEITATLQFGDGGSRGSFPMSKTAVRIGRGSDNDLSLNNDSVSRHHAEILSKRDGTFSITDLDSGNGVFVNGQEITQTQLQAGDKVEVGEVTFTFVPSA